MRRRRRARSFSTNREGEDTILERLHPIVKLLVAALACCAAFLFEPWPAPVAIAAAAAFLQCSRGAGPARVVWTLRTFPVFVAVIVLANVLLVKHEGTWWNGAAAGLVQSARVVATILVADLFLAVTDPVDLSDALSRALRPLQRAGLRTGEFSLMVMLALSFAPLMIEEVRRLELAQAARCGFPKRGPASLRSAVPLIAPLIAGVLRRADEIDLALRARAFRLGAPRSALRGEGVSASDWAVAAVSLCVFLAGVYAQF